MGTVSFSDALRNARANAIISAINNGSGPGTMAFYTSPRPAKAASITTQTLLGIATFSEPVGTVTGGVLTASAITGDSSADATGTAVWCRIFDGDGAFVMDLDVTDNAGAGPVKMPSTSVYVGGTLSVVSFVVTEGNT